MEHGAAGALGRRLGLLRAAAFPSVQSLASSDPTGMIALPFNREGELPDARRAPNLSADTTGQTEALGRLLRLLGTSSSVSVGRR